MKNDRKSAKLQRLNRIVDAWCGVYSRVARRLGVHRSYVSRVARGERTSPPIEEALLAEYEGLRPKPQPE
ncbi:MAG TPA: helix-turn-helix domain-containing protein [Terriglobales bacterium]|nr:helix-turn-helix domain-containing protein [Terriglobales bacterium]